MINKTPANKPLISNGGGFERFSIPARWNAENTSNAKPRNPPLLIAADRYKQLHVLNFVLEINRFKRENGNSKTSSCREKI
jgi:hypothetical protein